MTAQPDLWSTIPPAAANTYKRYLLWRESPDGLKVWQLVAHMALTEWRNKATRISVNRLCEVVRFQEKIHVNNTWRSFLSDSLVAVYPQLDALIERRKRTIAR